MLSRSQQKLLRKLRTKKHRWQEGLFVAEGRKVVSELLQEGLIPRFLAAENPAQWKAADVIEVDAAELKNLSALEQADEVIGVFPFPKFDQKFSEIVLIADQISDPGNLGTIIRTCDWFGINTIFCTTGTVDVFNAKTVQSTMGSIARVELRYADKNEIFGQLESGYELLCADMTGQVLTDVKLRGKTAITMGSESHGPSDFWKERAEKITIPRLGNSNVESLNVATATAIILGRLCLG